MCLGFRDFVRGLWDVSSVRTCVDNCPVSGGNLGSRSDKKMFLSHVFDMVILALMCRLQGNLQQCSDLPEIFLVSKTSSTLTPKNTHCF